jgi:hypothetical protein
VSISKKYFRSSLCDWTNSEDDVVSNTLLIAVLIVIYGDEVNFAAPD